MKNNINYDLPFFGKTMEVDVPKEFLFTYFEDTSKHNKWIEGLISEKKIDDKHFEETIKLIGIEEIYYGEVIKYVKDSQIQMTIKSKHFAFKFDYIFEDIGPEKTRLHVSAWLLEKNMVEKLFILIDKYILNRQLKRLKEVAEIEFTTKK